MLGAVCDIEINVYCIYTAKTLVSHSVYCSTDWTSNISLLVNSL